MQRKPPAQAADETWMSNPAEFLQHEFARKDEALKALQGRGNWLGFSRGNRGLKIKIKTNSEEEDEENELLLEDRLWKKYRLFPPHGRFKSRWDPLVQLLIMYNCMFIPLALAFGYQMTPAHAIFDYSIDGLFIIDMLISMSTVYYNEHYEMIVDRRQIIWHYVMTWFWVDLISILPFEVFSSIIDVQNVDQVIVTDFLKLPRMLRLARFRKRVDKLSGANVIRLIWLFVLFLYIAHLLACIWWAVGRIGLWWYIDEHSRSWILRMEDKFSGTQLLPVGDISLLGQQYMTSLFWGLTALLKTPSIGPDTQLEKTVTIIVTIFGVLIFTIFIGNMIEILSTVSHSDDARRRHLSVLTSFVKHAKLKRKLRRAIFAASDAAYHQTLGIDASALLHQFPRALRGQIVTFMHRHTLKSSEFLSGLSAECSKALLVCLTPCCCIEKEVLLGQGELCEYLYVLQRGQLQVRDAPATEWDEMLVDDDMVSGKTIRAAIATGVKRLSVTAANLIMGGSGWEQQLQQLKEEEKAIAAAAPPPPPGDKKKQGRSGRMSCLCHRTSTAPRRASTLNRQKVKAAFVQLEKAGAMVGLEDPTSQIAFYPYTVVASKTTFLLCISGQDVKAVLTSYGGEDMAHAQRVLASDWSELREAMGRGSVQNRRTAIQRSMTPDAQRASHGPRATVRGGGRKTEAAEKAEREHLSNACKGLANVADDGGGGYDEVDDYVLAGTPGRVSEATKVIEHVAEADVVRTTGCMMSMSGGGRKNSIAISMRESERASLDRLVNEDDVAVGAAAEEKRRADDATLWKQHMDEVRAKMSASSRKLAGLLSALAALEERLALVPRIAAAIAQLQQLATQPSLQPPPVDAGQSAGRTKPTHSLLPAAAASGAAEPPMAGPQGLLNTVTGWFTQSPKDSEPSLRPPAEAPPQSRSAAPGPSESSTPRAGTSSREPLIQQPSGATAGTPRTVTV